MVTSAEDETQFYWSFHENIVYICCTLCLCEDFFISYYENFVGNKVYCWWVNQASYWGSSWNMNSLKLFYNSTSAAITLQRLAYTPLYIHKKLCFCCCCCTSVISISAKICKLARLVVMSQPLLLLIVFGGLHSWLWNYCKSFTTPSFLSYFSIHLNLKNFLKNNQYFNIYHWYLIRFNCFYDVGNCSTLMLLSVIRTFLALVVYYKILYSCPSSNCIFPLFMDILSKFLCV